MKFVRVTAPYVTLKARDAAGAWVIKGMYKGGVLPAEDVDPDSLAHHLDSEMVETYSAAPPPEPAPEPEKAEEPKKAAPAKKAASA